MSSVHPWLLIVGSIPFLDVHPSDDMYAVFPLKPMHILSLGISILIEEYVFNMLSDLARTPSSMLSSQQQEKSYN